MAKRKSAFSNDTNISAESLSKRQQANVTAQILKSKKLLHRALKTVKGFERQKLGKRLKLATARGSQNEIDRINREITALKSLDLEKATEAHLQRSLLKVKAIAESQALLDVLRRDVPKPEGSVEERAALHNVVSLMYNSSAVKECVRQIIEDMGSVLGVSGGNKPAQREVVNTPSGRVGQPSQLEPGGHSSPADDHGSTRDNPARHADNESDFGSEDLSRYDMLIGNSSDSEGDIFEERAETSKITEHLQTQVSPSLSISRSPSTPPPTTPKPSNPKVKTTTKAKNTYNPPRASTFLPTLMGGYYSGSESASDISASEPPKKKNRAGQMARRQLAEKKYGAQANHVKNGLGSIKDGKDVGWDARKGAVDGRGVARGRGRGRGTGGYGGSFGGGRDSGYATGENGMALGKRAPKKEVEREGMGVMHPSWQAAKKAKEMKKTATFQGKKVTFD